jgi:membrane fusion protein, heavy metal efflux system
MGTLKTKVLFKTLWIVVMGLLLASPAARAGNGVVSVRECTITTRLEAYARVEPITILRLNAAQIGILTGLAVLPGETVKTGAVLGHLTGPAIKGLLAQRRTAVAGARGALTAAQKILASERQKRALHLTMQETFYQAEARLADAEARLDNARYQEQSVRESVILKAPVDGTVLSLNAADGEQLQAGQTILTLLPVGGLWLRARYYGSDASAVQVGMTGQFEPVGGVPAIPVKVRTIAGTVGPGGGQAIGLVATVSAPGWRNGEAGMVTIEGAKRTFVAVPTRALILDQGRWWVLVHTNHGNRPQEVIPGPSRGESTLIEQGLEPGAGVVVEDAYRKFHRDFSLHYLQAD